MYLIQQKVSKGLDPPQVLSPDMVPPSERGTPALVSSPTRHQGALSPCRPLPLAVTGPCLPQDGAGSLGSGELTGVKELDDISQEISQLQRCVGPNPKHTREHLWPNSQMSSHP